MDEEPAGTAGKQGARFSWCLACGRVTPEEGWPPGAPCPHCHAALMPRFEWSYLRRIKPGLPPVPDADRMYRLGDYP